jgi:hypothetical protein
VLFVAILFLLFLFLVVVDGLALSRRSTSLKFGPFLGYCLAVFALGHT